MMSIENTLEKLKIEARKIRERSVYTISGFVALATALVLIGHLDPQLNAHFPIGFFVGLIGVMYVVFSGGPKLLYPLQPEQRAFRKIAEAIDLLETSNGEAYHKRAR